MKMSVGQPLNAYFFGEKKTVGAAFIDIESQWPTDRNAASTATFYTDFWVNFCCCCVYVYSLIVIFSLSLVTFPLDIGLEVVSCVVVNNLQHFPR